MRRRTRPARVLALGLLAGIASYGHVLYPAWLAFKTRGKADPEPPAPERWPGVTVIVPAYRERAVIQTKIDDILANGYPGPVDVLVVADDPETAAAARRKGVDVLEGGDRRGKAAAVNRGVERAEHDVIVLTDANARLTPGTLKALARWFEDATVGAVAGEKRVLDQEEALYWRFEAWLKGRESRLGTTIGLVGELAALRKAAFRPLPTDIVVDDLWLALDINARGRRIVYEPQAVATENGSPTLSDEWERRTRNAAGVLDAIWRRRKDLVPGSNPATSQLWGHRLVRLSFGPAAHAALLVVALGRVRRSRIAALFALGHAAGLVALARKSNGGELSAAERLLAQVLFLQGVAARGMWRWVSGERPAVWRKEERAAPLPNAEEPER